MLIVVRRQVGRCDRYDCYFYQDRHGDEPMKDATELSIVCISQVGLDAMGTRQSNQTGLARTCWKSLLGALATTILASLGAFMAPELRAQTVERGQALPRPLPPGPGEERDPQLLSIGDGLQESVSTELPRLKLSERRPASGPGSVPSFIDGLKGNDAAFEVNVGQGRILTVKEDLAAGPNQPLIASGDPSVIEFSVINSR